MNWTHAKALVRFSLLCHLGVVALLGLLYVSESASLWLEIAGYSSIALVFVIAFLISNLRLLKSLDGVPATSLGAANKLTILRFVLGAPIVLLIAYDRPVAALVLYAFSGLTDIADGAIARRRGEQTRFGVMMDPTADILTTTGVFVLLYAKGLVPWWVLAILLARYVTLGLGSLILTLTVGPIRFKATPIGKIVGVLQAAAVILILALTAAGVDWQDRFGGYLYPFLAAIFGAVIVSKLFLAVRHVKGGSRYVAAQGKPRRLSADFGDADAEPRRGDG